jgi:hypothetical protein
METLIEVIGWIAMCITISSFFFAEMKTLRIINLIGCLIWMIYGTAIVSTPIVITNAAIALSHLYWFLNIPKDKKSI